MKKTNLLLLTLYAILTAFTAHAATLPLNNKTQLHITDLNPQVWKQSAPQLNPDKLSGLYLFEHSAIKDKLGRDIFPTIGIVFEEVPASTTDVIMYSVNKRMNQPFNVDKVLSHEDGSMIYKNAIGYVGNYVSQGVTHKLWIAHMLYKNTGVQIVADGTSDVFDAIQPDVAAFFKSMDFEIKQVP